VVIDINIEFLIKEIVLNKGDTQCVNYL